MPSHEGDIEQGFFRHPPELRREIRSQRQDVVQSAVVRDKNLWMVAIDIFQALDLDAGAAQPEVVFRPPAHAVMLELAAVGKQTSQDGNGCPESSADRTQRPTPDRE